MEREQRSKEMIVLPTELQSQERNQVVKSSKMCECVWVGEYLRAIAHTQATYGMYKNIVTSKFQIEHIKDD